MEDQATSLLVEHVMHNIEMKKNFQKAHEMVERSSFVLKNLLTTKGAKVGGPSMQVEIMSEKQETKS